MLYNSFSYWQIRHKVFRIVTDNAASMVKAYKFGLIVTDDDNRIQCNDQQRNDEHLVEYPDDNDFSNLSEWLFVDWNDNTKSSINSNEHIPIRLSCFAHSLQLAIRDGLKGTLYLSKSLSKCIQLARKSYKSTKIADLLEDVGKTINRSNLTRWSSEYLLIKSIVQLQKKTIDQITDIIDDDELKFNSNDFIVLQEAVEILEPFAEITSRVQSESVVTISLVAPSIVHLIDHLKNTKPRMSLLMKTCEQLEQSINKRFAGIIKRLSQQSICVDDPFSDSIYFIGAILDPEFKLYWLSQVNYKTNVEAEVRQSLIQMVLHQCEQINRLSGRVDHTQSSNENITLPCSGSVLKKRKLFQ